MPAFRRRPGSSPSEKDAISPAREQAPAAGGSPPAMPDRPMPTRPLTTVDDDTWWMPEDAQLAVGEPEQAERGQPIPTRRLLYAGLAIFVITTVSVVFLPDIVAVLTPMGAMVAFAAIVASAVVTAAPRQPKPERDGLDDARSIGCGGVRPVGELSRRAARRKNNNGCGPGGGSCGC